MIGAGVAVATRDLRGDRGGVLREDVPEGREPADAVAVEVGVGAAQGEVEG